MFPTLLLSSAQVEWGAAAGLSTGRLKTETQMYLPVTCLIQHVCVPLHTCTYVIPWHKNMYKTPGWCGMSNVYTDHVSTTDRPKGKPSDVDRCAIT